MRILLVAPGDSYSRTNFLDQFRDWGHDVTHWDFVTNPTRQIPESERYDLLFHIMVNDELSPESLGSLKQGGVVAKSLVFCCDDTWRLPVSLSKVGYYDLAITTEPDAMPLYRAHGHRHVRLSQYGVNPAAWRAPKPLFTKDARGTDLMTFKPTGPDVLFVGQGYVGRPEFVMGLRRQGINVAAYGQGFVTGHLDHEELVRMLLSAKIVLGLNWCAGGQFAGYQPQIKGRLFENGALGVFQLVSANRHLSRYFADDEIVTFDSVEDCAEKIRYYLAHPKERDAIAKRGQKRVLRDHTWAKRWQDAVPELEFVK